MIVNTRAVAFWFLILRNVSSLLLNCHCVVVTTLVCVNAAVPEDEDDDADAEEMSFMKLH
eukprot:m.307315 g.307315  ORF g.307315 m.307315 type:complete len:60 (-) comp19628_c1_seq3:872-1051(-)